MLTPDGLELIIGLFKREVFGKDLQAVRAGLPDQARRPTRHALMRTFESRIREYVATEAEFATLVMSSGAHPSAEMRSRLSTLLQTLKSQLAALKEIRSWIFERVAPLDDPKAWEAAVGNLFYAAGYDYSETLAQFDRLRKLKAGAPPAGRLKVVEAYDAKLVRKLNVRQLTDRFCERSDCNGEHGPRCQDLLRKRFEQLERVLDKFCPSVHAEGQPGRK